MPTYTYRREDGTTFDIKQSFHEDPLEVDPKTGQKVYRVIQSAGVIFKGSGFYVTDNKGSSRVTQSNGTENGASGDGEKASESKDTKAETTTPASKSDNSSAAD